MPNWVWNRVKITGDETNLNKFIEKAQQPYPTYYRGDFVVSEDGTRSYDDSIIKNNERTSPLSFWNFKKPENLEVYFGASDYKPEGYDKLSKAEQFAITMQHKSDGWYDWNVREWGTKWDASDSELAGDPKLGEISYAFNTAWSPAEDAYRAMVEQHPQLSFEFYCEEEQGWGVEYQGTDGELVVLDEWDIPNSHSDYKERDNVDGCICNYEEDAEEWYDDCPNKAEEVGKLVEKTMEEVAKFEDISEMIV